MKDLTYQAWERTMDAQELIEAQDENREKELKSEDKTWRDGYASQAWLQQFI